MGHTGSLGRFCWFSEAAAAIWVAVSMTSSAENQSEIFRRARDIKIHRMEPDPRRRMEAG